MDLLFLGENTPEALLKSCPAHPDRDIRELKKALPTLLSESPSTTEGFKTQRGLVIGSTINEAVRLFGNPHERTSEGDSKVLSWFWYFSPDLDMNVSLLEQDDSQWRFPAKPIERSGASFSAKLYFRENKLIGLEFLRDTGNCQ